MQPAKSPTSAILLGPDSAAAFRVLRYDRIEPDREQICRLVHLRPGHDNHRRWFDVVDELLGTLPRLMRPRGVYRINEVAELTPRRLVFKSGAAFEGAIGTFLHDAALIATFIVTIGSGVERLSRGWLRAGKIMQGTIADAIASESVEAAAQQLRADVRAWAQARGLEVTPAYSPGYCGMTVRQQVPLFASLPAQQINVRLTASCLMLPVKSVSGLIGIGPADRVRPEGYPCEACDHPNCMQRRAAFDVCRGAGQDWGAPGESCPPEREE